MYKYNFCSNCGENFNEINETYYVCPKCDFRIFVTPKAAAGVFLFNNKGEVLFLIRAMDPGKGLLGIPGGFINSDETIEQAAKREVFEEIGVKINKIKYFRSHYGNYLYKNINYKTIDIFYIGKIDTDVSDLKLSDEATGYKFLKVKDINLDLIGNDDVKKAVIELVQSKLHLVQS